jgi:hypothetical protein
MPLAHDASEVPTANKQMCRGQMHLGRAVLSSMGDDTYPEGAGNGLDCQLSDRID